jgi:hypothetical protein
MDFLEQTARNRGRRGSFGRAIFGRHNEAEQMEGVI